MHAEGMLLIGWLVALCVVGAPDPAVAGVHRVVPARAEGMVVRCFVEERADHELGAAPVTCVREPRTRDLSWRIIPLLALLGGTALVVLLYRGIHSGSVASVILVFPR